jgi:hemoglobin-like flavoprotein
MVSQKTIEIVKATAPIIKEKGEEITKRMYQITFEERPDYKPDFSRDLENPSPNLSPARREALIFPLP